MKILEGWGRKKVTFFYGFFRQRSHKVYPSVDALFHDKIVYVPVVLAFLIGVLFTLPIVFYEVFIGIEMSIAGIAVYLLVLTASVFLEFYFLFLLGFLTLAYYIHHLYRIDRLKHRLGERAFRASLVRTAMELPEEKIVRYNVDPYEYREKHLFLLSLLYKAKVILTNYVAKFLVKKLLSRTSLRGYSAFISAPVTGIWDAVIFLQTMRRARYKLVVRFTARYLIENKMPLLVDNTALVLKRYYYFGEYCNTLNFMLQRIYLVQPFELTKAHYLESEIGDEAKGFFALLLAMKQGTFSAKEKGMAKELEIYETVRELQQMIRKAQLDALETYVETL